MKKLSTVFETSDHASRAYNEIRLLRHVLHDNVIELVDIFINPTNSVKDFKDM